MPTPPSISRPCCSVLSLLTWVTFICAGHAKVLRMNSYPRGTRPWTPIPTGSNSTSASTAMSCTLGTTQRWRPCCMTSAPRRSPVLVGVLPARSALLAGASPRGQVILAAFPEEAPAGLRCCRYLGAAGGCFLLLQDEQGRARRRPASPVVLLGGAHHGSPPRVKKRHPWQLQGDALESSASSGCLGRLCLRAHQVLLGFVWAGGDKGSTLSRAEPHTLSCSEETSLSTLGSAESEVSGHPVTDFRKVCRQWFLSVEV